MSAEPFTTAVIHLGHALGGTNHVVPVHVVMIEPVEPAGPADVSLFIDDDDGDDDPDPEPWEFYDDDGSPLPWVYDDGGRGTAGPEFEDEYDIGDCVTRAIAIATGRPYANVYATVDELCRSDGDDPDAGADKYVPSELTDEVMSKFGWRWVPLRSASLVTGSLPDEPRLVAVMSGHMCAVINGVMRDTWDCVWDDDEHEQRARVNGVYLPPEECQPVRAAELREWEG
jgi:hypothetical protein